MKLYYSGGGGSRNFIPETMLKDATIMLSYFVNCPNHRPDRRLLVDMKARKKARKNDHRKGKS